MASGIVFPIIKQELDRKYRDESDPLLENTREYYEGIYLRVREGAGDRLFDILGPEFHAADH